MDQNKENLEEYKVEVIEKYNEATQNTFRNRNIFTVCAITFALLTVGADILDNTVLSSLACSCTINSGLVSIYNNLNANKFEKSIPLVQDNEFISFGSSIKNCNDNIEIHNNMSLIASISMIVMLGLSILNIVAFGNNNSLISMMPYCISFKSIADQHKDISKTYQKVLNKIEK